MSLNLNFTNPHPWLSDIRALSRMLNDELDIPHAHANNPVTCDVCNKAVLLKNKYVLTNLGLTD